jgi:hypothetical protein
VVVVAVAADVRHAVRRSRSAGDRIRKRHGRVRRDVRRRALDVRRSRGTAGGGVVAALALLRLAVSALLSRCQSVRRSASAARALGNERCGECRDFADARPIADGSLPRRRKGGVGNRHRLRAGLIDEAVRTVGTRATGTHASEHDVLQLFPHVGPEGRDARRTIGHDKCHPLVAAQDDGAISNPVLRNHCVCKCGSNTLMR